MTSCKSGMFETYLLSLVDTQGTHFPVRALADNAAGTNIISTIGIPTGGQWHITPNERVSFTGITSGSLNSDNILHATLQVQPDKSSEFCSKLQISLLITNHDFQRTIPTFKLPAEIQEVSRHFKISDTEAMGNGDGTIPFDLILGNSVYNSLNHHTVHKFTESLRIKRTIFGDVLTGPVDSYNAKHFPRRIPIRLVSDVQQRPVHRTPPPIVQRASLAYVDQQLADALKKYIDFQTIEMQEAQITKDLYNEQVLKEYIANLERRPDPTPTNPNAQRFIIRLPWIKERKAKLSNNRVSALKRFTSTVKRFERDADLHACYRRSFRQWIDLGFLAKEPLSLLDEMDSNNTQYVIMPHQVVHQPESKTTPWRVVLDGGAADDGYLSLNDSLETGPNLLPDLRAISIKFRFGRWYYTGDITKAFMQLELNKDDQFIYMYWAEYNPATAEWVLELYRFIRMPWGLNSSPFCLNAVIHHLFDTFRNDPRNHDYVDRLMGDTYVDDIIQTDDQIEQLAALADFADLVLNSGAFDVTKKESNSMALHKACNPEFDTTADTLPQHKVLGTLYDPITDTLGPCVKNMTKFPSDQQYTKRFAMRANASLFDPMGFSAPVQMKLRRLMQTTCIETKNMDTPLSPALQQQWRDLISTVGVLEQLRVKRLVSPIHTTYTLHVFCDACTTGYGAVAYIIHEQTSTLLASIVRTIPIAELNKAPIARIELLAAVVGAQLRQIILTAVRRPPHKIYMWSDNQAVLCWVRADPIAYGTYLRRRISSIQLDARNSEWRFCPGLENPADVLSRGCTAPELLTHPLWLTGPPWITKGETDWPEVYDPVAHPPEGFEEINKRELKPAFRQIFQLNLSGPSHIDTTFAHVKQHSLSFKKLVRLKALVIRWCNTKITFENQQIDQIKQASGVRPLNYQFVRAWCGIQKHCKDAKIPYTRETRRLAVERFHMPERPALIQPSEYNLTSKHLVRETQKHYFKSLYEALANSDLSNLNHKENDMCQKLQLRYHLDDDLIYSHGRIIPTTDRYKEGDWTIQRHDNRRKPLLLIPDEGIIATSIIQDAHIACMHGGRNDTMHRTRTEFWIIHFSKIFRNVKRHCRICNFFTSRPLAPPIGDLPSDRTAIVRPFQVIGMDYAGPLFHYYEGKDDTKSHTYKLRVRDEQYLPPAAKKTKTEKKYQGYALVITCASTRAVAFYLTEDQTAKSVALAYNAHCSIYGPPSKIYSDNGASFLVMKSNLQRITEHDYPTTTWHTIPSYAPWWGGFYERIVGMMKKKLNTTCPHLRIRNSLHGHYLLQHVSGCLNARPLWGVSTDAADATVISPNSFLQVNPSQPEIAHADPANVSSKTTLQRLHAEQTRAVDQLWKEFHLGYLTELRNHQKSTNKIDTTSLVEGELVLYHSPRTIRNYWPIAKVIKTYPDEKGVVRSVKLAKYVPNEINLPLKSKKYGNRRLTTQMKRELLGYFKHQPHVYPVRKLVRYEFWNIENPSMVHPRINTPLPIHVLTKTNDEMQAPCPVQYKSQEPTQWQNGLPITNEKQLILITSISSQQVERTHRMSATADNFHQFVGQARRDKEIPIKCQFS